MLGGSRGGVVLVCAQDTRGPSNSLACLNSLPALPLRWHFDDYCRVNARCRVTGMSESCVTLGVGSNSRLLVAQAPAYVTRIARSMMLTREKKPVVKTQHTFMSTKTVMRMPAAAMHHAHHATSCARRQPLCTMRSRPLQCCSQQCQCVTTTCRPRSPDLVLFCAPQYD